MSHGFSGGKQMIKCANTRNSVHVCFKTKQQKKESFKFNLKDGNSKLWMETIIWTLLNSILTVFNSTTRKNDIKLDQT